MCSNCAGDYENPDMTAHTEPEDLEEQAMRDRALKIIRKASVSQQEEGGFILAALRDRGIL